MSNFSDKAPGQAECDTAANKLTNLLHTLDTAMMEVMHQTFAKRGGTLQSANQQVARSAAELIDTIEPLRQAAKFEAENIGHTVNQLVSSL